MTSTFSNIRVNNVTLLWCNVFLLIFCRSHAQIINAFAGSSSGGFSGDNGPATSAQLKSPYCVRGDYEGNLYIADYGNHRIRKVSVSSNLITTFAGTGQAAYSGNNGPATSAALSIPLGLYVDSNSNVYIADTGNHRVRRVSSAGIITLVAGTGTGSFTGDNGPATSANLKATKMVFGDSSGNIYIVDSDNNRIRKVSTSGIITTIAGNGMMASSGDGLMATAAAINSPSAATIDRLGNIYIMEYYGNKLRKIDGNSGIISTFAGTGICSRSGDSGLATAAGMCTANDIITDSEYVYYTEEEYGIRKVSIATNIISTYAGSGKGNTGNGGPATSATFLYISSIFIDSMGDSYLVDFAGHNVRKIDFPEPSRFPTQMPSLLPSSPPTTKPSTSSPTKTTAPSRFPTRDPSIKPTRYPTRIPSVAPTTRPTTRPTVSPTSHPTYTPTTSPSHTPSTAPSRAPSARPTKRPSTFPTFVPTRTPSSVPTQLPTTIPTQRPSHSPSLRPSHAPTAIPTTTPTTPPTETPSATPSFTPTHIPSVPPTISPSLAPSKTPSFAPTKQPTQDPTFSPTRLVIPSLTPSAFPTMAPTASPTKSPSYQPSISPTQSPTKVPTAFPTNEANSPQGCANCMTLCNVSPTCSKSCPNCIRSCFSLCIQDCMSNKCTFTA